MNLLQMQLFITTINIDGFDHGQKINIFFQLCLILPTIETQCLESKDLVYQVAELVKAFVVHPRDEAQISAQTENVFLYCLCHI
jgi:hypothetical protein